MSPKALLPTAVAALALACADGHDPMSVPEFGTGPASTLSALSNLADATLSSPVFGLALLPGGVLAAAETSVGVTFILQNSTVEPLAPLPGVTGVVGIGTKGVVAVTGAPQAPPDIPFANQVFYVTEKNLRPVADLNAFEQTVNPDGFWNTHPPESNPFNVTHLSGSRVLVADAAANDILVVDGDGRVDWVAALTPLLVPTEHFKRLIGCFAGSQAPECGLPNRIPAEPVATSVAVARDGSVYAGELTGFPGQPGFARIWRIAAGKTHVVCPSADCTMVIRGLTSIVDLEFGPDGTLYVVEFDAAGWIAVEVSGFPFTKVAGGRVRACDVIAATCTIMASGLSLPAAVAVDANGKVWIAEHDAIPFGTATVRALN